MKQYYRSLKVCVIWYCQANCEQKRGQANEDPKLCGTLFGIPTTRKNCNAYHTTPTTSGALVISCLSIHLVTTHRCCLERYKITTFISKNYLPDQNAIFPYFQW